MERKIGEIFEFGGEWYQCVKSPDGSCKHCDMNFGGKCPIPIKECVASSRSDLYYVIFKKLEKVGEPITVNGKNVQLLKTTIANCDNCAFYKDVNCDFTCYPRKCHGGEEGTYVEIKQTKKGMEEKKLNLKPFDIQKAREGKPVCTRDGRKARIIAFDRRLFYKNVSYPILALVERSDGEDDVCGYNEKGKVLIEDGAEYKDDLMMLPEKKEGWINIIKTEDGTYCCKGEVHSDYNNAFFEDINTLHNRGITVKIEWME